MTRRSRSRWFSRALLRSSRWRCAVGKRIPAKVREEAAMLCAIGASTLPYHSLSDIQFALDVADEDVWHMAARAYHSPTAKPLPMYSPERYAEAESLLRCGWSPGD